MENARLYADSERANRSREELLAIVSHDLRNPLNTIVATAGTLQRVAPSPERAQRAIQMILRAAASMAWPSTTSTLIGFCTQTSAPALIASTACPTTAPPRSAAALVLAAPAVAGTHELEGVLVPVDVEKGIYRAEGSLIGTWTYTSFQEIATSPLYHATGTEKFDGCLDRRRDGSCSRRCSAALCSAGSSTPTAWRLLR